MRPVIDVHGFRSQRNPELAAWLETVARNHPVRTLISKYDICTARRQSLANFIANDVPRGYTHLIQLDDDMVPVATTEHILVVPGDLVYCGYAGRGGRHGHHGDGDFGCGCCRISAELAGQINVAISFNFGFDETKTRVLNCECQTFRDQAVALGYEPKMVGVIGHCVNVVIVPTDNGVLHRWPAGG